MRILFDGVTLFPSPKFLLLRKSIARLTNTRNLAKLAYIRQVIRSSNYFSSFSLTSSEGYHFTFLLPFFSIFARLHFSRHERNSPLNSLLEISSAALYRGRRNRRKGNAFSCMAEVFPDCTKQIA